MFNIKIITAFILVIIIWSTTPLAIKWSSVDATYVSLFMRMLIGMVFCFLALFLVGNKMPFNRLAIKIYVLSGASLFGSMALVYYAAQSIPSGWMSVLFGLTPLSTGLFSTFFEPEIKLTKNKAFGIALGIVGLYLVFSASLSFNEHTIKGVMIVLCSVLISSSSSVFIRQLCKNSDVSGMHISAGSLLFAIPFFAIAALMMEPTLQINFTEKAIWCIFYLGIVGSAIGFTLYYYLLKNVSANHVALITLITPVCALCIGSLFNNEPVVSAVWYGAACVFLGLIVYEYKPKLGLKGPVS